MAWVKPVLACSSSYRACRQARVRFHTTRTQPNVRLSTLACPGAGYARHLYAVTTTKLLRSPRFGKRDTPKGGAAFPPRPEVRDLHAAILMTVISLDALGLTSPGAVASLLAAVLAASPAPATLLLETLARTQIRIEVLGRADRELTAAEHYRLDAGRSRPDTTAPGCCAPPAAWWRPRPA